MAALPNIRLNSDASPRRQPISGDDYCVIVDDFLQDPEQIVEFAALNAAAFAAPEHGYPGLLFDVNDAAMTDIYRYIRHEMSRHFPFLKGGMRLSTCLSMATLQPAELSNLQRLCHTDPRPGPDRRNYAALVYLFRNEALGGTGFYRWQDRPLMERATALERDDPAQGLAFLQQHFPTFRAPPSYMTASNEIAELLAMVPARFNRLVFYSGDIPHSAAIEAPELLSHDFREGRLTLNCFASVLPR